MNIVKRISFVSAAALLCAACAVGFSVTALSASAEAVPETSAAFEAELSLGETYSTAATNGIVESPEVKVQDVEGHRYIAYYCFVAYEIQNRHQHTVDIMMGQNNGVANALTYYNVQFGESVLYFAYPSYENYCYPNYYLATAYCATCGLNSSTNGIMINDKDNAYNAKCTYGCTKRTVNATIPTSYDQAGTVWEHNGSDTIYFTIACNGEVANGTVKIPPLFTRSTTLTVGGVTFGVRTGPNKVSVKANTEVTCTSQTNVFAFYAI